MGSGRDSFKNSIISLETKDGDYKLTETGQHNSFSDMQGKRKDINSSNIKSLLNSPLQENTVYSLANVGVSGLLTTSRKGELYFVFCHVPRKDGGFNDTVIKLPSGYVDSCNGHFDPLQQLKTEFSEELLISLGGNRVSALYDNKELLTQPYSDQYQYSEELQTVLSLSERSHNFGTLEGNIYLDGRDGKQKKLDGAKLYISPQTNSAQLVYPYTIQIPEETQEIIHKEDDEHGEHSIQKKGIILMSVESPENIYYLSKGELVDIHKPNIMLSEFFNLKNGISQSNNIEFANFLKKHKQYFI